jgi:hypothetical protein|nr:MAG TPA: hypothetical protein [Caudoviricetes sp.]
MEISIYTDADYVNPKHKITRLDFLHQSNVSKRSKAFFLDCIKAFDISQSKFLAEYNFSELLTYDAVITLSAPYIRGSYNKLPEIFNSDVSKLSLNEKISPIVYTSDAFRTICDCLQKPFIFVPFVFHDWVKENKDYYSTDLYRITSTSCLKKELQDLGLTNQSKVLVLILSYTTGVKRLVLDKVVDTVISTCEGL